MWSEVLVSFTVLLATGRAQSKLQLFPPCFRPKKNCVINQFAALQYLSLPKWPKVAASMRELP